MTPSQVGAESGMASFNHHLKAVARGVLSSLESLSTGKKWQGASVKLCLVISGLEAAVEEHELCFKKWEVPGMLASSPTAALELEHYRRELVDMKTRLLNFKAAADQEVAAKIRKLQDRLCVGAQNS